MPALKPVDWQTLARVFELDGFTRDRVKGSHLCMTKPGVLRPLVIPMKKEVGREVIKSNLRTAGMSRQRYFQRLRQVR